MTRPRFTLAAEVHVQDSQQPCPFCGELIRAEAQKCRFCRRMLDGAPRGGAWPGSDFWGPVLVLLGVFGVAAWLLRPSSTGAPERFVGPDPAAVARALSEPVGDGGAPSAVPVSPDAPVNDPLASGPASTGERPPLRYRPTVPQRPSVAPMPPVGEPSAPASSVGPDGQPASAKAGDKDDDGVDGPPLDVRHPWFGYGTRVPNALAWQVAFAGASRHAILRSDETARIQMWIDAPAQDAAAATAPACLKRHLAGLDARLRRAGLRVKKQAASERAGARGLAVHGAQRIATGRGPRRDAGHYYVAAAAHGNLCFAFEGFAGQPAGKAARRQLRGAYERFDVDPRARAGAATAETRAQLEKAIGSSGFAQLVVSGAGPAALEDAGTALAALWPADASGWALLGSAHLGRRRATEALGYFARALTSREDVGGEEAKVRRMGLYLGQADAHALRKKWEDAERALGGAKGVMHDHPHIHYALACLRAQKGDADKAIDALEAALREWPVKAHPPRIPHGLAAQVRVARLDGRLRSLRAEPRFEVLLRQFEARARKAK